MALLIALFGLVAVVARASASCGMMAGMMGSMFSQCREAEGCGISDEYFRRFISMDLSLFDEDISGTDSEQAWNFVSCLYTQAGIVDDDGCFNKDGFDMYIGVLWKKGEKEEASEIIKCSAEEASAEGKTRAEKVLLFYRKLKQKGLQLPERMREKAAMREVIKTCLERHQIGFVDMCNLLLLKHPMTDTEASYAACFMTEYKSDGDELCTNSVRDLINMNPDKERAAQVMGAYDKCLEGKDFKEKYHKRDEFDGIKNFFQYIYDCFPQHCEDISYDDMCPIH